MFRSLVILFSLCAFVGFSSSCKKYSDDSSYSLKSKDSRLQKEWKLIKAEQSGNTVQTNILYYVFTDFNNYCTLRITNNGIITSLPGTYSWEDSGNHLDVNLNIVQANKTVLVKYKVKELYGTHLKLEGTDSTGVTTSFQFEDTGAR